MTIVGVAPARFAGVAATQSPDLFVPLMMKARVDADLERPRQPPQPVGATWSDGSRPG